MPKIRTRKTAAKRFRVTTTGKIMRRSNLTGHLKMKKSGPRQRRLDLPKQVSKADRRRVRVLLAR
jgi:large subunit ribosomal protein L35